MVQIVRLSTPRTPDALKTSGDVGRLRKPPKMAPGSTAVSFAFRRLEEADRERLELLVFDTLVPVWSR